jgi:sugar lactone lactonase YvrE
VDAFKTSVLAMLLVFIAAFGFIAYVIGDAIEGIKIPGEEYGIVISKGPVTDGRPANYTVGLENGKQLYITSNTTAYETLEINQSYLFSCRIDVRNRMTIIDSALQIPRRAA